MHSSVISHPDHPRYHGASGSQPGADTQDGRNMPQPFADSEGALTQEKGAVHENLCLFRTRKIIVQPCSRACGDSGRRARSKSCGTGELQQQVKYVLVPLIVVKQQSWQLLAVGCPTLKSVHCSRSPFLMTYWQWHVIMHSPWSVLV